MVHVATNAVYVLYEFLESTRREVLEKDNGYMGRET
jgi:hypothetical protein